jgi:hypothetical protein
MTELYEVVRDRLKYAGRTYQRGDTLELIGSLNDEKLIGKYVRKYEAPEAEVEQCAALTASGSQCKRDSLVDSEYCGIHRSKIVEN